jgi:hypothetical protein
MFTVICLAILSPVFYWIGLDIWKAVTKTPADKRREIEKKVLEQQLELQHMEEKLAELKNMEAHM